MIEISNVKERGPLLSAYTKFEKYVNLKLRYEMFELKHEHE